MTIKHRFLVTGGAGFIGSHIVERLLDEGHFVRVLDDFSSGKKENLSFTHDSRFTARYELIEGDIRDYDTCAVACDGMDYVLHQAALRSVPKSMELPNEYNAVNIDGTVNMLKAAGNARVRRFVFASSSSVYGDAEAFPQKETDPNLLVSPYALTKLAGEYYCRIFSVNYGLETACLRYFNVFGPRQAPDDEYSAVIPKFITCMLNGQKPPIYGDGTQSRDFTYVGNVVEANIKTALAGRVSYPVLNVALGREYTILGLVNALNSILGKNLAPEFLPKREGDVMRTLADISRMKAALDVNGKYGFEYGLTKTIDWFKEKKTCQD